MRAHYARGADASGMRCPRCLKRWGADGIDLDAEVGVCRRCDLTVALLGTVLPEWKLAAVEARLDALGAPITEGVTISELPELAGIELRSTRGMFRSPHQLSLDAEGARSSQAEGPLPLRHIARVVPAVELVWDRGMNSKELTPRASVQVQPLDLEHGAPLTLEVATWTAARYLAARMEAVRRALRGTGAYR